MKTKDQHSWRKPNGLTAEQRAERNAWLRESYERERQLARTLADCMEAPNGAQLQRGER